MKNKQIKGLNRNTIDKILHKRYCCRIMFKL